MEGLRQDVIGQVRHFIQEYVAAHIDEKDLFQMCIRDRGWAFQLLCLREITV